MSDGGKFIDGNSVALKIQTDVRGKIDILSAGGRMMPKLASLSVGDEKDAMLYINAQKRIAKKTGIGYEHVRFSSGIGQEELEDKIEELNNDGSVTAMLLQHPLPDGLNYDRAIKKMRPDKDVEGIHPFNLGKLFKKDADIIPCTPGAVMRILKEENIDLYGKDVVIIGHSPIVGKPLSLMMLNETATTAVCHIGTAVKGDIKSYTRKADILVVAVGKPHMVKKDWIKKDVIIIDVGINNVSGKVCGDVDLEDVEGTVSLITPVPGGVGPVTVSILMRNVLKAYESQNGKI